MKFYEIDNALTDAINAADKPLRLKIEIDVGGYFETVSEQDILEANYFGLKEIAGGTSARGEITINNEQRTINIESGNLIGHEVRVSFSIGEGLPYFQRFVFYIDDKGIQDVRGPGRKRYVRLTLRDLSYTLRKSDEARDWTSPAVFTYSVICDKSRPDKSLVHGIAKRAGLSVTDIDCSTIPVTLPYVNLRRNVWAELSSLATAYRCHLECPVEKPLLFAHSPYQLKEQITENSEQNEEEAYEISGEKIFYFRKTEKADYYRNTVRLKVNMPVSLEKQNIWHYEDPPVFYDEFLQAHYPFKYPLEREIERGNYEAHYQIKDSSGKERNVAYADQIDTKDEAENRLDYDGGPFSYSQYDITTNHDKAILKLQKENEGDLYNASIHGRPIVFDLNRSCFLRDIDGINTYGTVAMNLKGSYFSEYDINGVPQYEDWVIRELAELLQRKREFMVKTHRALFHARVGAKIQITMNSEKLTGIVNAFSFRYRKNVAFTAVFRITETGGNNG